MLSLINAFSTLNNLFSSREQIIYEEAFSDHPSKKYFKMVETLLQKVVLSAT